MRSVRLILVGGFLGAGKTTTLVRLARHFTDHGLRVGIITNDQADNLVDTQLVKIQGFNVEEVNGGCFCCRLHDFTDAGERLLNQFHPDVILAEPVGSCTDLVATVIQPLKLYAKDDYTIAPYTVLIDPIRAKEVIVSDGSGGFSEKVIYIFRKQLEEADIIGLNKMDTLQLEEKEEVLSCIKDRFPRAKVVGFSAYSGEGFLNWVEVLESKGIFGRNIAEVNYDIYAEGEAELAWFNSVAELSSDEEFDANEFLFKFAEQIRKDLNAKSREVAHIKLFLSTAKGSSSLNLVSSNQPAKLFLNQADRAKEGRLLVNARVHTDPESLQRIVTSCLKDLSKEQGINTEIKSLQSFRPGKPVPVYRFKEPQE
jgi:G3E family GTPase